MRNSGTLNSSGYVQCINMCKNSLIGSDSTVVLLQVMYFSGGKFNTRQLPLIVLNIEAYIAFSVSIRYMSRSGVN